MNKSSVGLLNKLGIASLIAVTFFSINCNSAPQSIPFSSTRALVADTPALVAIENQIAAKKSEQDALDLRRLALQDKEKQNLKDESIQKEQKRLDKEYAVCQAELALLIGKHQLEAARALKMQDIEERTKTVAELEKTLAEKRKDLAEAK